MVGISISFPKQGRFNKAREDSEERILNLYLWLASILDSWWDHVASKSLGRAPTGLWPEVQVSLLDWLHLVCATSFGISTILVSPLTLATHFPTSAEELRYNLHYPVTLATDTLYKTSTMWMMPSSASSLRCCLASLGHSCSGL